MSADGRFPETEGETSYEWMEGGFFLIQRGAMKQGAAGAGEFKFMEIIGYEHSPEASGPAEMLTSRIYTSGGNTLDYTHEVDDRP